MPRTLLLCFIHGFRGNEDTFHDFPYDLKREVSRQMPDQRVESIVYPKYETTGELGEATKAFLEWLKERVMDVRKAQVEKPWPPHDRDVGVVLVAHSMGGFVAADTLFLALRERAENGSEDTPLFPLIQGILTFDTAYNGLARSMFVYGAFSNYSKVSSVFNVMTAIGAAAPASLGRLATQRAATSSAASIAPRSSPAWRTWQLVAVRTGSIGAIAAGGVAAYVHREAIIKGLGNIKNINKESVAESYRQGMETLGQGLAYINRGNVGKSFAWLSDHFAFVGALLKPKELSRRLDHMAAVKGVGMRDFYTSLGENGYWSGGYFVPERTFCAVPEEEHSANSIFSRLVLRDAEDEIVAHMNMFRAEKNANYGRMKDEAADLVKDWFLSDADILDDPQFREPPPEEVAEDSKVEEALKNSDQESADDKDGEKGQPADDELPDESPIDIAAAASLVPLPEDGKGDLVGNADKEKADTDEQKQTYTQYLLRIAQQTESGAKSWWPSKMPQMPQMPSVAMPSMPKVPSGVSSLGQVSLPSVSIWGKKREASEVGEKTEESSQPTEASQPQATQGEEPGNAQTEKAGQGEPEVKVEEQQSEQEAPKA